MKRLSKWLLLLLGAFAVLATVVLFNPGLIKQPLEHYLANKTGYSILLDGDIDIDVGRTTGLTARKIKIASPGLSRQPNLVELGELKVSLQLSSVFKDQVIINSLVLNGLQLRLENDADGKGNWQIPRRQPLEKKETVNSKRVVIRDISISNTDLRFYNGKTDTDHVFLIESLSQQRLQDGMLHTELKGLLNNRRIDYSGKMGPYDNILKGRDIQFESEGYFGELKVSGKGLIDSIYEPKKPSFMVNMEGPNIDEITAMLGIDDLGGGGFSLSAKGGQINEDYEAGINGSIGDVSIHVSAKAIDITKWDELDLSVSTNGPNLDSVMRAFGVEHWPEKPFNIKANVKKTGRTLDVSELVLNIGGTRLQAEGLLTQFPHLDASHIKLHLSGEDMSQFEDLLGISGLDQGKFDLKARVNVSPDGVELVQVDMQTSRGTASVSGSLGDAPSYQGSKFKLHIDGPNAQVVIPRFQINALPDHPFSLNADLELVDNGIHVDQAVLLSNQNERLDVSGLITFNPGVENSYLDVKISGQKLATFLQRMKFIIDVPDRPYHVSGKVSFVKNGLELTNISANSKNLNLDANGLVMFESEIAGSFINFDINHENISDLSGSGIIGDAVDIFVPGHPLHSSGRLGFMNGKWKLSGVKGLLGETGFEFDALISKKTGLTGSNIRFSTSGPDIHELFSEQISNRFSPGPFKAAGQVELSDKSLIVKDLMVETVSTQGQLDLLLDWPIKDALNVNFNVNAHGQDIRTVLPAIDSFEAAKTDFRLTAEGKFLNNDISFKSFSAAVGNLDLEMVGQVQDDSNESNFEFTLIAKSPDISSLGYFKGEALPGLPLDIRADFSGNASLFAVRNLVGSLGESKLSASLDVSRLQLKPSVKVLVHSEIIDLSPIHHLIGDDKPEPDETTKAPSKDRLIPATPLPLDLLNSADIDANIKITELKLKHDNLRNLNLELVLLDGNLALQELFFNAPKGTLKASMSVLPLDTGSARVKLDMNASDVFFNISGIPSTRINEIPVWDLDLHATGVGGNLQELAGSANGAITLKSSGGLLEGLDLSLLDFFIMDEVFGLLMPKSKQTPDKRLTCSASILNIKDGLVETDPAITFSTEKIAIISKGTLNLKNEKMKFNFNAIPQNALKISAGEVFNSFILIGGTLTNPSVGLDPGNTILQGGLAIGTAGISVLAKGVLQRMGNTVPLCEQLLNSPSDPQDSNKK